MPPEQIDAIDLREYLSPLRRYASLIVTFCAAATLSSIAFTYAVSERFKASTTILYQPREEVSFRPKARDALGFPPPLVPLESIGNTLQEILTSDAVVTETVRTLRLDVKEPKPEANLLITAIREAKDRVKEYRQNVMEILKYGRILEKDPFRQAILTLKENAAIKRTSKAYTFELEVVHQNPAKAAEIVDVMGGLLSKFLAEEHARTARESRVKLEPRVQLAEREIADLRRRLEDAKASVGVASLSEELSLKIQSTGELQDQLTAVANELHALEKRRVEVEAQLASQKPDVRYESTTTENPVVEDLNLSIARLEVERSGLLEKFTPMHQTVKAVDAKLAEAREKLEREQATIVSSESTRVNDIHRKLLSDKLDVEAELETLRARERALRGSLAASKAAVRRLAEKEPQISDLALQLKAAEGAYELIHQSYEEARLAEARETSEVSILHEALVPAAPARPIKIVHVGTSLALSLCLAIGLALFSNLFDATVRGIAQAEQALDVPVLTTIPELGPEDAHLLTPTVGGA